MTSPRNVLFLCTGNSARSIMAEAYANHAAGGAWRAHSAGSTPTGAPNPFALETLRRHGIDPGEPRSKSWDEFAADDAPKMDLVVTVCDNAAGEVCPVWPTRDGTAPQKLHWSLPDPAAAPHEEERRAAFEGVFQDLKTRIDGLFTEYAA
ncbi:MAG: arsenate reductase ArsC [Parvularculaceae bacterium]